jgi:hypothetical protein
MICRQSQETRILSVSVESNAYNCPQGYSDSDNCWLLRQARCGVCRSSINAACGPLSSGSLKPNPILPVLVHPFWHIRNGSQCRTSVVFVWYSSGQSTHALFHVWKFIALTSCSQHMSFPSSDDAVIFSTAPIGAVATFDRSIYLISYCPNALTFRH